MNNKNVNLHLQMLIKMSKSGQSRMLPRATYFNESQRKEGKESKNISGKDAYCSLRRK